MSRAHYTDLTNRFSDLSRKAKTNKANHAVHTEASAAHRAAAAALASSSAIEDQNLWLLHTSEANEHDKLAALYAPKPTRAQQLEAAIADGYWITKDHGRWYVGHGTGSDTRVLTREGRPSKEHARDLMLELHQGAKK